MSTETPRDNSSEREEKLRALQERLTSSVEQLVTGEDWKRAIEFAARFRSRSFNNTLLIYVQHLEAYEQGSVPNPTPTHVAGYKQWQQLDRNVMKGQAGYQILAPVTARFASSNPADPDSWQRLRRGEKPVAGQVVRTRMIGVRPAYVWDVSQTDGKPIPQTPAPQLLQGQAPPGLRAGLIAQVEAAGFTVVEVPDAAAIGGANGLTNFTSSEVSVRIDMDEAAQAKTLAHELGHVLLHHPDNPDWHHHRGIGEVEAESFALMIGAAHGLDTTSYTVPYVASWAQGVPGKTPIEVVQATADRVCKTASKALSQLETEQIGNGVPDGLDTEGRDITADKTVRTLNGAPRTVATVGADRPGRAFEEEDLVRIGAGDTRWRVAGIGPNGELALANWDNGRRRFLTTTDPDYAKLTHATDAVASDRPTDQRRDDPMVQPEDQRGLDHPEKTVGIDDAIPGLDEALAITTEARRRLDRLQHGHDQSVRPTPPMSALRR